MDNRIDLVEKIINNIPNDLTLPIEKARFIYIELGKILEFNTTYNNTTNFNKFIIRNKHHNINNLKDNQIVCHNWADIYIDLLKQIDIKAYKVSKHHAWVIIKLDNMLIYADATLGSYTDLSRIKHHDEIINFYPIAKEKTQGLPRKEIIEGFYQLMNEIDRKIGYKKTQYDNLHELKRKISTFKTLKEKVDYLLKQSDVINDGYYEATSYIQYIFTFCLDISERKNIFINELKKTQEDGTVDLIKCISLLENESYEYYVFQKNVGISQISKTDLMNYANSNYGISQNNSFLEDYPLTFQVPKRNISILLNNIFSFQNKNINKKIKY